MLNSSIINLFFKAAVLSVLLTFCYASINAQAGLNVFGKMKVDKSTLDQAHLTISKDGSPFKTGGVEKNGKFDFMLQLNHVYLFTFSKPGYVTKKILVDTHVPKDKESRKFDPFEFIVTVFDQNDTENKYAYNQPVARIRYSEFIDEFDYDTDYTKSLQARFDAEQAAEKEKQKDVMPDDKQDINVISSTDSSKIEKEVNVISPRGGSAKLKEPIPIEDVDKRNKIKAQSDKDDRKVIRPGVAIDNKPTHMPVPKINLDAKVSPFKTGIDSKPHTETTNFKHKQVENYREHNMHITLTTLTIGEDVIVYRKVVHDWGGVFYFKDGLCIGKWIYESEISEYTDK